MVQHCLDDATMEITQTFVVRAPPDAVWAFLTDPHRVAGCLPGAAITDRVDERTYAGTITVNLPHGGGPMRIPAAGTLPWFALAWLRAAPHGPCVRRRIRKQPAI